MKTNNVTTLTFKAKPLYGINLKLISPDKEIKLLPANFSKLSLTIPQDSLLVTKIKQHWGNDYYNMATQISDDFFDACIHKNDNSFFITELINKTQDQFSRTMSIMETTNPKSENKNLFSIEFLQSKNAVEKSSIKGAGELSIYGAIKLALENCFEQVYFHSLQNDFYKKIGLTPFVELNDEEGFFLLNKADCLAFINKVKEKYSIKDGI